MTKVSENKRDVLEAYFIHGMPLEIACAGTGVKPSNMISTINKINEIAGKFWQFVESKRGQSKYGNIEEAGCEHEQIG